MKMGERSKLMRNLRQESRRFRLLVIVIGFFLVTLTFIVVAKPEAILFSESKKANSDQAPSALVIEHRIVTKELDDAPRVEDDTVVDTSQGGNNEETGEKTENEEQRNIEVRIVEETNPKELTIGPDQFGEGESEAEEKKEGKHKVMLPTVSNYTINDSSQSESTDDTKSDESTMGTEVTLQTHPGLTEEVTEPKQFDSKPLCDFSNFRANVCEMEGNIIAEPTSNSIMFNEPTDSIRDETWKIKPYPRKGDEFCLSHTTELTVKSTRDPPQCTKYHSVPGVVFSITGYTGNLFHDFTDVIVPLFTTTNQFNGEVQFLISDFQVWWVLKYQKVLKSLSNYPPIDFLNDKEVHCFKHIIVGLHAYREFTIDTTKSPNNYSMADFNAFMRRAYGLERGTVTILGEQPSKKPRLLIIARKRTRAFLNLNEIIDMARDLGYEVVINEADVSSDLSHVASVVNSCDVMMGVHGAGLTNCVFLPQNATLIQIVPWGGLDWISRLDFGDPSIAMGLRYSQYSISVDESSLLEQYPRDHEIFKNPFAFHKKGFNFIRQTFMDKQNVKLDVKRFRSVLLEALDHLNP